MTNNEVLTCIAKMISSGEIPKDVYDKYLSKCPIGFMNETELTEYLIGDNVIKAIHRIQLLQMDGEVEVKDLGLIVRDLKGEK